MEKSDEAIDKIRNELLGDADDARREFRKEFKPEIDEFISKLSEAVAAWRRLDRYLDGELRKAACSSFVYISITQLLVSTRLLIEGYLVASGNLMRQVTECIPIPLLFASKQLDVFERFDRNEYSTNRSIQDAISHADKLSLKKGALEDLKGMQKWYDQYSHPSKATIGAYMSFEVEHGLYVGASYDPAKREAYKKEIDLRVSVAGGISNVVDGTIIGLGGVR